MRLALEDAKLEPSGIDYINAHATATEVGDIAESIATYGLFGDAVPISSTKGHTGHTLGGCGAIEAIFCLMGMRRGFSVGTRNLESVDPRCAPLRYLPPGVHETKQRAVMTNNFAFGGINTSLVLGRAP
jgi:3-oxoacyl-[acyl-carrier-protein] synthase II